MSGNGKAEKLRLAEARVSETAIPAEWAEQIMEMISACSMKSIEGTNWEACEEIALCIKRQHPGPFADGRYRWTPPQEPRP
jgi:hypothetical protein